MFFTKTEKNALSSMIHIDLSFKEVLKRNGKNDAHFDTLKTINQKIKNDNMDFTKTEKNVARLIIKEELMFKDVLRGNAKSDMYYDALKSVDKKMKMDVEKREIT